MSTFDYSALFKNYRVAIDNSPYPKMPKHLKPMLDSILSILETEYMTPEDSINRNNVRFTSLKNIRVLEISIKAANHTCDKFYFLEDSPSNWGVYDEEEFEDEFFENEDVEDVYIPPQ